MEVDEDYKQGGGSAAVTRFLFKAVVQLVLFFGA